MTQAGIAGVDVGGSGIRARMCTEATSFETRDHGPVPRQHGLIDVSELSIRITSLVSEVQCMGGVEAIDGMAIGLTGMPGRLESAEELATSLCGFTGLKRIVIASDSLTTHIGALGGAPGSIVAAGTGAIALGTDHKDVWNRADGWGLSLGDEGSGAWIGARGINAALRCHDRREGGSKRLLELVGAQFGDVQAVLRAVNDSPEPAHVAAQFAPSVAAAALDGDTVAAVIWAEAGRRLAQSAHAASLGIEKTFSWGGALFDVGDLLLVPFTKELFRRVPEAILQPPAGGALDGAVSLARHGISGTSAVGMQYVTEFAQDPNAMQSV